MLKSWIQDFAPCICAFVHVCLCVCTGISTWIDGLMILCMLYAVCCLTCVVCIRCYYLYFRIFREHRMTFRASNKIWWWRCTIGSLFLFSLLFISFFFLSFVISFCVLLVCFIVPFLVSFLSRLFVQRVSMTMCICFLCLFSGVRVR